MERSELGHNGEDAALDYLQKKGMALLARNWRSEHYEIDLVMDDGSSIRIVEVIAENPTGKEIFFDVVTVLFCSDGPRITYIPSAFLPVRSLPSCSPLGRICY